MTKEEWMNWFNVITAGIIAVGFGLFILVLKLTGTTL